MFNLNGFVGSFLRIEDMLSLFFKIRNCSQLNFIEVYYESYRTSQKTNGVVEK